MAKLCRLTVILLVGLLLTACNGGATPAAEEAAATVAATATATTPPTATATVVPTVTATLEPGAPTPTTGPTATAAPTATSTATATTVPPLQLTSSAFNQDETIPRRHACAEDVSPELVWSAPPAGTQSFVIIMDDPDAPGGGWDHWLLFNIPADSRGLAENVPAQDVLADGSTHGANSWDRNEYGGPCPPVGSTHHYSFRLYALDIVLDLAAGVDKEALLAAMAGHILDQSELVGLYTR